MRDKAIYVLRFLLVFTYQCSGQVREAIRLYGIGQQDYGLLRSDRQRTTILPEPPRSFSRSALVFVDRFGGS